MANEIRGVSVDGTLYARIMNRAGLWWNGSTFEAYSAGNYSTYDIAMTEQGDSGVYVADFPTAITVGGSYEVFIHLQAGASPAQGDLIAGTSRVDWTGTAAIYSTTGAMTGSDYYDYVLRKGFKRTDKAAEVYEAITDAVQLMRRRFSFGEAEVETETTDQIVLGEYKLDLEDDFGMVLGVKVEDNNTGIELNKVSKSVYDSLYPDQDSDTTANGFPTDYCIFAGQILLGPRPDSADYNYRISYSARGGTITSSTVGVPFTDVYRDALTDLVYYFLYDGLDEPEKADRFRQRFEAEFLIITRKERMNKGEVMPCMDILDI